jgi:hypothetical protein
MTASTACSLWREPRRVRIAVDLRNGSTMRFIFGPIPDSRTLDAETAGWTPLAECSAERFPRIAGMLALPFLAGALMVLFNDRMGIRQQLREDYRYLLLTLGAWILLVPLHEFIHAVAYLKGLGSPNLVMGIWPPARGAGTRRSQH